MPSFDVVCKVDLQEVDNAINQTLKEVGHEDQILHLRSADDFKVRALADILKEKLARRQVPLKALLEHEIEPGPAGSAKQRLELQQGIPTEKARELVKLVKDAKLKVQAAIQGDQVRISGKKRDDLQAVIQILRDSKLDIAMQYINFRD
jgi:hypothetical protein